jgi:ribosomal protein S18 acetylase RimI-like enzyme
LLTTAFERAGARGATSYHLNVQVENTGAIALYRALGFELRDRLANVYGPGLDGLLMVRRAGSTNRSDDAA